MRVGSLLLLRFLSWSPKRRWQGDPISVKTRQQTRPGAEVGQEGPAHSLDSGVTKHFIIYLFGLTLT